MDFVHVKSLKVQKINFKVFFTIKTYITTLITLNYYFFIHILSILD